MSLKSRVSSWLLAAMFVMVHGVLAQGDAFSTYRISDAFYIIYGGSGYGANVGVHMGADGILLVDAMVPRSSERLLATLREQSEQPIRYVLNTHGHADHNGGNAFFAEQGATIIAQENVRYRAAFRGLTFREHVTLRFNGEEVRAIHVTAHAFDDALVFFPQHNVLFMGDTFTTSWHPTFGSGGLEGQYAALDLALSLADDATVIVPGHGLVTDRAALVTYRDHVTAWMSHIATLYHQGYELEAMLEDARLWQLTEQFNRDGRAHFVPPPRYRRFLERVLSSELVVPYTLPAHRHSAYSGTFGFGDGTAVEIVRRNGTWYAQQEGAFMAELIPVSEMRFLLWAELGDYIEFHAHAATDIDSLSLVTGNGETVRQAVRER